MLYWQKELRRTDLQYGTIYSSDYVLGSYDVMSEAKISCDVLVFVFPAVFPRDSFLNMIWSHLLPGK
jgi:hypothetical protein